MRKKHLRITPYFAVLGIISMILGGIVVQSAQATPLPETGKMIGAPAQAPAAYTPSEDVVFNEPHGSKAEEREILTQVVRSIDAVPSGGQARGATYLFDRIEVSNAFIRADRDRKVVVKLVIDRIARNRAPVRKLIAAFKNGGKSGRSVVKIYAKAKYSMHPKFVLLSQSGDAKEVVQWGSANWTYKNSAVNYNDWVTQYGCNYKFLVREFDRLISAKKAFPAGRSNSAPCGQVTNTPVYGANPWTTTFNSIDCKEGTIVEAAVMKWTSTAAAKAARKAQARGCKVRLLTNRSSEWISSGVVKELKKKTDRGKIELYKAKPGHGLHDKWMVVRGKKQVSVYTGSLHPGWGSQRGVQMMMRLQNTEFARALAVRYHDRFEYRVDKKRAQRR